MKIVVVLALVAMAAGTINYDFVHSQNFNFFIFPHSFAAMPTKEVQPQTFIGRNPGKIVGGVEAAMHEFPFMLEIRQGGHWCGGTYLSV